MHYLLIRKVSTELDLGHQYEKEACLQTIEADILKESRSSGEIVIVCFGGPSAGGKSSIAQTIAGSQSEFSIVHMDDYMAGEMLPFKAPPHPQRPFLAGINPEVFDLSRMHDDILKLASGKTIDKPIFDRDLHKRARSSETFPANKVILIEGLYALTTGFVEHANFGVFVEASLHDRLMRKIIRGLRKYGHKDIDKIICSYLDIVEPNYSLYTDHLKSNAKYVVQNNGLAEILESDTTLKCPTTCEEGYALTPKYGNGSVHPGESLTILKSGGILTLVYRQKNIDVLVENITHQTFVSLSKYYEMKAFTHNA